MKILIRTCLDCNNVFGCVIDMAIKDCFKCTGGLKGDCLDHCEMKRIYLERGLDETTGICQPCLARRKRAKTFET